MINCIGTCLKVLVKWCVFDIYFIVLLAFSPSSCIYSNITIWLGVMNILARDSSPATMTWDFTFLLFCRRALELECISFHLISNYGRTDIYMPVIRCQNLTSRVEVLNLKFPFAPHRHHEQYSPAPALLRCPTSGTDQVWCDNTALSTHYHNSSWSPATGQQSRPGKRKENRPQHGFILHDDFPCGGQCFRWHHHHILNNYSQHNHNYNNINYYHLGSRETGAGWRP